jgi:alkylated DNA repair dioxygenase AlkB
MDTIDSIPDVRLTPSFLPPSEASALFASLQTNIVWDERMKARKTACFGQTYDDSGVDYQVVAMHPLLVPLCDSIEATLGFRPTNCLLNYYDSGASTMGHHSDAVHNLAPGTGVAIVSLGGERKLTFRKKTDYSVVADFSLPHGSLLYMSQELQGIWTHALKKSSVMEPRISLTFRHILEGNK